jgi:hypothetical protein
MPFNGGLNKTPGTSHLSKGGVCAIINAQRHMDAGSFCSHAERNQFEVLLCLPMAQVPLFL